MNERRQRAARAGAAGLIALAVLGLASGCDVRSSAEGAQTAIALAQTVIPAAQTVMPGVQATAQAGVTVVGGVLSESQGVAKQVQAVLAGASVRVGIQPTGATNDAVTEVTIDATDARGTLSQLDANGRRAAASAALVVMGQYYPNATISLTVLDASGGPLVSGTRAPGQMPSV